MTSSQPLLWQLHSWLDNSDHFSLLSCGHDGKHPNSRKILKYKSITVTLKVKNKSHLNGQSIKENKCSFPRFSVKSRKSSSFTLQWLVGPLLGTEQMAKSDIVPSNNPTNHCKMRFVQISSPFLRGKFNQSWAITIDIIVQIDITIIWSYVDVNYTSSL